MRDLACAECVVSFLAPPIAKAPELDLAEQEAIEVLAASGLVPPLRLVTEPQKSSTAQLKLSPAARRSA